MRVAEVAEYLGVSKDLVYQLVREKEIPHVRLSKRVLIFDRHSIDDWISDQEYKNEKGN
ncbi:helix-turn-helix domain-containing protein [Alkalihalobacillus sp. EGI L200015]|nr:helix-turn-helix domain-containing protein [Pseudalkalibacillus salsuginis]